MLLTNEQHENTLITIKSWNNVDNIMTAFSQSSPGLCIIFLDYNLHYQIKINGRQKNLEKIFYEKPEENIDSTI